MLKAWIESEQYHPSPVLAWQASFVLKFGHPFTPKKLPADMKAGVPSLCFENCQQALVRSGLTYCEGYALHKRIGRPAHHAWLSTPKGIVVDLTWAAKRFSVKKQDVPMADEYYGVAFKRQFILDQMYEGESLLNELWRIQPDEDELFERVLTYVSSGE